MSAGGADPRAAATPRGRASAAGGDPCAAAAPLDLAAEPGDAGRRMTAADFEARYRAADDPWAYRTSPYERAKYAATLAACGPGPFAAALELGASIGAFTALLAPRCERLATIDASPTAVARARMGASQDVEFVCGAIPADLPHGPFDLVVASEVLYYLTAPELETTTDALRTRMSVGARLVAVHWTPPGPERPLSGAEVHTHLCAQHWLVPVAAHSTPDYLLDVLERR